MIHWNAIGKFGIGEIAKASSGTVLGPHNRGLQCPIWTDSCKGQCKPSYCFVDFLNLYIFSCTLKINNPPKVNIMIRMAFMRFIHAWGWISVCWQFWFEGYHPKLQGETNFLRGTDNVLQAYDHKTQCLIKNRCQQKCLEKALLQRWVLRK